MRGDDRQTDAMFRYVSAEQRVPSDHPLRAHSGAGQPGTAQHVARVRRPGCPPSDAVDSLRAAAAGAVAADMPPRSFLPFALSSTRRRRQPSCSVCWPDCGQASAGLMVLAPEHPRPSWPRSIDVAEAEHVLLLCERQAGQGDRRCWRGELMQPVMLLACDLLSNQRCVQRRAKETL